MSRLLLKDDKKTGIKRELLRRDDTPNIIGERWEQRIDHIIDDAQAMEEEHSRQGADIRLAARIPLALYMELQAQGITDDPVLFKRWLNDPDNKAMRVYKGAL